MGQVSLPVLQFSPVSTIPLMPHSYLHLHVVLTRWTKRLRLGTLQKSPFRKSGLTAHTINFHSFGFKRLIASRNPLPPAKDSRITGRSTQFYTRRYETSPHTSHTHNRFTFTTARCVRNIFFPCKRPEQQPASPLCTAVHSTAPPHFLSSPKI